MHTPVSGSAYSFGPHAVHAALVQAVHVVPKLSEHFLHTAFAVAVHAEYWYSLSPHVVQAVTLGMFQGMAS